MNFFDTNDALRNISSQQNYETPSLTPVNYQEYESLLTEHGYEFGQFVSEQRNEIDDYDAVNKEIKDATGIVLPNPLMDLFTDVEGLDYTPTVFYQDFEKNKNWWNKEVEKIKKNNPNIMAGKGINNLEYYRNLRSEKGKLQQFQISQMQQASKLWKNKYGAGIVSGVKTYFTDPFVLATMPLSFGYSVPAHIGKAAIKVAATESLLEFSRLSAIESKVLPYKQEVGLDYELSDSVRNVGYGTLGAFVFSAGGVFAFRGLSAGTKFTYKGTKGVVQSTKQLIDKKILPKKFAKEFNKLIDEADLSKSLGENLAKFSPDQLYNVIKELPEEIQTSPKVLRPLDDYEQYVLEQGGNPYEDTINGMRQHHEHYIQARDQLEMDQPISLTPANENVALKNEPLTLEKIEKDIAETKVFVEDLKIKQQKTIDADISKKQKDEQLFGINKQLKELQKKIKNYEKIKKESTRLPERFITPKKPKTETFLQWLGKNKIRSDDYNIGEVKAILDKSTFRYTKKDGYTLDQLLVRAREDGWLPMAKPGEVDNVSINEVLDLISENALRPEDAQKVLEYDNIVDNIEAEIRLLEENKIDPRGMTEEGIDTALRKIRNRIDNSDVEKYSNLNDSMLDKEADDAFDDLMNYFDEQKIDMNEKFEISKIDEDISEPMTAQKIIDDIQDDKKIMDELSKCKGLQ